MLPRAQPALDLCGIHPMLSPALTIVAPAASAVVSTTIDLVLEPVSYTHLTLPTILLV